MINELVAQIEKKDAPIVVGLDPMLSYVPEYIQKKAFSEYGETLKGAAEAIWEYNKGIIDATYDLIPAVKPQIAMYHCIPQDLCICKGEGTCNHRRHQAW